MAAFERFRNRWAGYVAKIAANREPGYIGDTPYLLILRGLALLALIVKFVLPFSSWTGEIDRTRLLILSLIAAWLLVFLALAFVTRKPFERTRLDHIIVAVTATMDVIVITTVCEHTGIRVSDFWLFFYLPILTSAEFLPMAYLPFMFAQVYLGHLAILYHFYDPGSKGVLDLVVAGVMRGGFLVTVSVLSVLLTRLQKVQNAKLDRRNSEITALLDFHREIAQLSSVGDILDRTQCISRDRGTLVSTAGVMLKDPASMDLQPGVSFEKFDPATGLLSNDEFDEERLNAVSRMVARWGVSRQPQIERVGQRRLIAAPLHTFNIFRGVVFAYGWRGAWLPVETADFISSLAEIAGLAMARVRGVTIFQEIARAPLTASASDSLIDWLLRHLTEDRGFDFAAISAVDPFAKTISMIRARNVEPGWTKRTHYPLNHKDVLADIVRNAKTMGRAAAEHISGWDKKNRFDEQTFELFGHSKLTRIFAPLLHGNEVVGVLEAGCSIEREKQAEAEFDYVVGLAANMGGTVAAIQPHELLAQVAQRAMEIVGYHSATIHLYADLKPTRAASAGLATERDFITRFPPHEGGIGAVARRTGEFKEVLDTGVEASYPELYKEGVRAIAAFPMTLTERREGVLYLHYFEHSHELNKSEIAVVKSVVKLMEVAILSRQSLDDVAGSAKWGWMVAGQQPVMQSLIEHSDVKVVLDNLVQKLRWMFGANSVVLYLYDQGENAFTDVVQEGTAKAVKSPGVDSLPYQLVHTYRETRFFEQKHPNWAGANPDGFAQIEGIESCAAVVLRARKASEIVGVMFVNYREKQDFSTDTRQAINSLGASAAIAIATARLREKANRELAGWTNEVRALREIDDLITQGLHNPTRDEVLKRILEHAIKLTGAPDGVIYLFNPDEQKLEPLCKEGFAGVTVRSQRLGEGIVGQAAEGRQTIRVPDVGAYKNYKTVKADTISEMAVPLLDRDEVLGVINLEHTRERFFNEHHQDWLETLAMQGAIAIRSLEAFRRLEAPLRSIGAVTGRIQREKPDLNTALRLVLTGITAKQGLSFSRAMLFRRNEQTVTGILAVGPASGIEADQDWKKMDEIEEKLWAEEKDVLEYLLENAEQVERAIGAGAGLRALDMRTRGLTENAERFEPWFRDGLQSGGAIVERNKDHPARVFLSGVISSAEVSEEFAVIPLRESKEKLWGFLVVDRAYQARARPIQNVDLKNLEAFGELASLVFQVEGLRGRLSDPQKQKEWEEFVRYTMHTVSSEVTVARGKAYQLRDHIRDVATVAPQVGSLLDALRDCHERALEAVNRVDEYARPLGTFQQVDLGALTNSIIANDDFISYQCEEERPVLISASTRLKDALRNVIINAEQVAKEKRIALRLSVTLARVQDGVGNFARLEFRDNAGGIPPDVIERIVRRQGVGDRKRGLGLRIVEKVVSGHGGRLEISAIENGTQVIIYIPTLAVMGE